MNKLSGYDEFLHFISYNSHCNMFLHIIKRYLPAETKEKNEREGKGRFSKEKQRNQNEVYKKSPDV